MSALFGILIMDREPYMFADLPGLLQAWLQDAGGFVFCGLLIYVLVAFVMAINSSSNQTESNKERTAVPPFMLIAAVIALFCYLTYLVLVAAGVGALPPDAPEARRIQDPDSNVFVKHEAPKLTHDLQGIMLTVGGFFSILGAAYPVTSGLRKLRFRRIWAIARLTVKEAWKSRIILVFLLVLLPILFPVNLFLSTKAEDELRMRVTSINLFAQVLLLLTAAALANFAIPNDVKNQNIYTIMTKPVVPFEIVLGRFLGYCILLTLSLAAMTVFGLIIIEGGNIHEKAREETYKARVPVRGNLKFFSSKGETAGTDVGREFTYRKYIAGDPLSTERAVWSFNRLPSSMAHADGDMVVCEFTFDIFRLTKGEENRGVDVNIRVCTWQCGQRPPHRDQQSTQTKHDGQWLWRDAAQEENYKSDAKKLLSAIPSFQGREIDVFSVLGGTPRDDPNWPAVWQVANTLAEKYGFYEIPAKEVYDFHPEQVILPAGLFRNAASGSTTEPRLNIYVKCTSRSQMLGMAAADLYLMEAEKSFAQNYLKSAVGLWCRVVLILGLAICVSTYLAGVVSFLVTAFLFLAGFFTSYLAELASKKSSSSGPFTALNQLLQAKQSTMPDDGSATGKAALLGDEGFAWLVRRFINIVPDVESYSWTTYLSEGFNVPIEALVMNLLTLLAYLLPWFLLGYYLMRSREVAA